MTRVWKALHRSGWEFWLPLPLIAIAFWVLGNAVTEQVLLRSYPSVNTLPVEHSSGMSVPFTILAINVEINRYAGRTIAVVRTDDATVAEIQYEFSVVEVALIERAIAQELGVTIETVRRLASYRIQNL